MPILRPIVILLVFFSLLFYFREPLRAIGPQIENGTVFATQKAKNFFDYDGSSIADFFKGNINSGANSSSTNANGNSNGSAASTANASSTITNTVKATSTKTTVKNANRESLPPLKVNQQSNNQLSIPGIVKYTNNERERMGLKSLISNPALDKSATAKLEDMFSNQYFEHVSPSGISASDVIKKSGYEYLVVGENLALGNFGGDSEIVGAWMDSPGHKANILDTRFTEIGVAVGYGVYKGQKQWIAVQHFARPMSSCPSPNTALRDSITKHKNELEKAEADLFIMKSTIDSMQASTTEYNDLVTKYNNAVSDYNTRLQGLKDEITLYNEQVKQFNACLETSLAK